MKIIGNNPAADNAEITAVASGTLPSGQPVVVNADGTVSVAAETSVSAQTTTPTTFTTNTIQFFLDATYDSSNDRVVVVYCDGSNSNYGTAVVGTVSSLDNSITFGTPVVFDSVYARSCKAAYDANAGKIVIAYYGFSNPNTGLAIVGTVSGSSISFGSRVTMNATGSTQPIGLVYAPDQQKVVCAYTDVNNSSYGTAIVGTVSGNSISFGSETVFNSGNTYQTTIGYDTTKNRVLCAYRDNSNSDYGNIVAGTVSGTTITFGSEYNFSNSATAYPFEIVHDSVNNKNVIFYSGSPQYGKAIVATLDESNNSLTFGTEVQFKGASIGSSGAAAFNAAAGKIDVIYKDESDSNKGKFVTGTVSGTSISFTSETTVDTNQTDFFSVVYNTTFKNNFIAYGDETLTQGEAFVNQLAYTETNLTSENFIGMAGGVVTGSVSAVGIPAVSSTVQSSYFGSTFDSNSNKVVVTYWDQTNSKGMAVVGTVSGTSISFGTPVEYSSQSAFTYPQAVVFDSNSNKVVISYVDSGGSSYGTAIVGTVSGTSISFGTAVVFESASTAFPQATFDSTNNKVVIIYEDGGDLDKGKAVVGTVSGTSISFGSPVTFEEGLTSYPSVAYDTNAQKVVIAFKDRSAADHGKAIVGTVSGSSISFGSAVTFNAADSNYNTIVYDASAKKLVIYYQDTAATSMKAIVGTVSGTSISFGTATEFSASNSANMSATYDASASKTLVFYRDALNSNYGAYNAGTIDGTSISFSDPVVFEAADSRFTTGTYDSNSQKVIVSYEDVGNSQYATSTVINVGYITRAEVADGNKATIDIGCAISTNQLGLTAGQTYYVQTDGTLGLTAADPSVIAGTAISATEIIVKG